MSICVQNAGDRSCVPYFPVPAVFVPESAALLLQEGIPSFELQHLLLPPVKSVLHVVQKQIVEIWHKASESSIQELYRQQEG